MSMISSLNQSSTMSLRRSEALRRCRVPSRRLSRLLHHEQTTWGVGILTALAGHQAATALVDRNDGRAGSHLLSYVVLFAALTLLFYWLCENPLSTKLPRYVLT